MKSAPVRWHAFRWVLSALFALSASACSTSQKTARVILPPGASFGAVTDSLAAHGVVANKRWFKVLARIRGVDRSVHAGVYEFPAGTSEKLVEAGTFLGYQGNFSGDPNNPVGIHLHFSIVEDDGNGKFKNELEINNTLDPSPYLGLPLNGYENRDQVPTCEVAVE